MGKRNKWTGLPSGIIQMREDDQDKDKKNFKKNCKKKVGILLLLDNIIIIWLTTYKFIIQLFKIILFFIWNGTIFVNSSKTFEASLITVNSCTT